MSHTAPPSPAGPALRNNQRGGPGRLGRLGRSLGAKLIILLVTAMVAVFALLGYLNVRLHRYHLETAALHSAERMSDVVKRSTQYHMLRNDRDALYTIIDTIGKEPGVERIRIINQEGRISFSTDGAEVGKLIDKSAEACYGCHAQAQPLVHLNRPDRFRIYRPNGGRVLGIINPIENQPSCANAACHYHPPEQKILGVLDTNLSLKRADTDVAESTQAMVRYTALSVALICVLSALFVWRLVHVPVKQLKRGTEHLARGELGYQLDFRSGDELGELASSFNRMSRELRDAREEVTSWARTLEDRVEEKTRQLTRAHEQMLQVEKMASIGKLAATVAHEINNPLAGILTYAKLLKKWIDRGALGAEKIADARSSLELIESESRRCGDIVRNLLTFSRSAPMNLEWVKLNDAVERCLKLVQHQAELNNVQIQAELAQDLPNVQCDPGQIEQLVLALVINAVEAMPRGGNLWVLTQMQPELAAVRLEVKDDGVGIPADLLPHLFEPFFTTKERGRGVGLGLAISQGIVERHGGRIKVDSVPGQGTRFTILLPVDQYAASNLAASAAAASR